ADKERKRKVCDIQDARNLALAYIKGDVRDFVWTPSDEFAEHRDVMFAYRDTVKEFWGETPRLFGDRPRKRHILQGFCANYANYTLSCTSAINRHL
ncbi:MAG: hypothetical protein IKO55_04450, partial [Kiritimatiellae bacterium]|nr:hypothetical protein [Kiritimatiellia bacterium]